MGVFTDGERACAYEHILYDHLKNRFNGSIPREQVDTFWQHFIKYNQIKKEQHTSPRLIPYFQQHFKNTGINGAQAEKIVLEMLLDRRGWYRIRAEAADTIRLLAKWGIKIVLTTDCILPSVQRRIILQYWGILQYFDLVLTSQEWGRKTGLVIFKNILAAFGNRPPEVLHIGDSIENDILPAKNVGFQTCLFTDKNSPEDIRTQDKPDYIVTSFPEVDTLIKRINGR